MNLKMVKLYILCYLYFTIKKFNHIIILCSSYFPIFIFPSKEKRSHHGASTLTRWKYTQHGHAFAAGPECVCFPEKWLSWTNWWSDSMEAQICSSLNQPQRTRCAPNTSLRSPVGRNKEAMVASGQTQNWASLRAHCTEVLIESCDALPCWSKFCNF